jgi:hypothetical protein
MKRTTPVLLDRQPWNMPPESGIDARAGAPTKTPSAATPTSATR